MRRRRTLLACAAVCAVAVVSAHAERLPVRVVTSADGLPCDDIHTILVDARGFVWFGTAEGLSRFDGHVFANYGAREGLPGRSVDALLESRDGALWLMSGGSICRLNPEGAERFTCTGADDSKRLGGGIALYADRAGTIWAGGVNGLFELDDRRPKPGLIPLRPGLPPESGPPWIRCLAEDGAGNLWIAGRFAAYRRHTDGTVDRLALDRQLTAAGGITELVADGGGHLWATTQGAGLCEIDIDARAGSAACSRVLTVADGLPSNFVTAVRPAPDGGLWVATDVALARGRPVAGTSSWVFRSYGSAAGLNAAHIGTLAEDRDGGLWCGSEAGGAVRIEPSGFTTFTEKDGLQGERAASIVENRAGELCVVGSSPAGRFVHRFDGNSFTSVRPRVATRINSMGWGWGQTSFQDREGDWWVATGQGLARYSNIARVEDLESRMPTAFYGLRDGLAGEDIFRLYEDRRGDIWITNVEPPDSGLSRWERRTGRFIRYGPEMGLLEHTCATAFAEDSEGDLWIGTWGLGLARLREGRFTSYGPANGAPGGMIRSLLVDHAGRLWIASTEDGLVCVERPEAETPVFHAYTTAQGLSSNSVHALTEDDEGHLYVGTLRGVDQFDPSRGAVRHFTIRDGLAASDVSSAFRDRHGTLWFGTLQGLSRFTPRRDARPPPVSPLITGIRVGGVPRPVSEFGQADFAGLEIGPTETSLEIDFVSPGFPLGDDTRYQFRLEGQNRDFGPPTDQRSVIFPAIAPGRYRFVVRAERTDGATSERSATVHLTVLSPVWQRWWFLTAAAILVAAAAGSVYRLRVARLIALERVRASIATDLHDDIGASLSRIAIISEVAQQRARKGDGDVRRPLETIAAAARELVDTMGDIVWAVDPKKDSYADLVQRMRDFAEDLCASAGIELRFHAADDRDTTSLDARLKRQVFLVFKESVNNAVKHSGCASIETRVRIADGRLSLTVLDDGKGIAETPTGDGHGLANLKRRAAELHGSCEITSEAGHGTKVEFGAPLRPAARRGTYRNA